LFGCLLSRRRFSDCLLSDRLFAFFLAGGFFAFLAFLTVALVAGFAFFAVLAFVVFLGFTGIGPAPQFDDFLSENLTIKRRRWLFGETSKK